MNTKKILAENIIFKSKAFSEEFIETISNELLPFSQKQVYFIDNVEKLKICMTTLQSLIDIISGEEQSEDSEIDISNIDENQKENFVKIAKQISENLRDIMTKFQEKLYVNSSVSEEEIKVDSDSINKAMENNETTKKMVSELKSINNELKDIGYTHVISCDGKITMFEAHSNEEISNFVNSITESKEYKEVYLYEISLSPVPLKKKTVFAV